MSFEKAHGARHGEHEHLDMVARLRAAGLRPTRQRVALGELLFAHGDRHLTAETLQEEAQTANVRVSLATVYNTLHQFTEAGLLRQVSVDGARTYFDTNVTDHHHYFLEEDNRLIDVDGQIRIGEVPAPPDGMEVTSIEVVVRCRRTQD